MTLAPLVAPESDYSYGDGPQWSSPDWRDLVNSFGLDVLEWHEFGSYQGDIVAVLADGERRGWLVIGYGSCSGCDALQGVVGYESKAPWTDLPEVVALRAETFDKIRWFDAEAALRSWLACHQRDDSDAVGDWYFYDDDVKERLAQLASGAPFVDSDA